MAKDVKDSRDNRGGNNGGGGNSGDDLFQDRIVDIARVAKVVKGGRRFSFRALVVVGDSKDKVGFGIGKANEVPDAIRKASEQAKKDLLEVPKINGTIPFPVTGRYGSASVLMFPAKKGKGIIAGGPVRTMVELAGIQDIVCKVHGTKNHSNVVRAVIDGLQQLMTAQQYVAFRDRAADEVIQVRS